MIGAAILVHAKFCDHFWNPAAFCRRLSACAGFQHQPSSAEKAYLDAVNAAVDMMAADAAADTAARYPQVLLLARQAERNRRVSELEADARKFIAGHNVTGDLTRVMTIRNEYTSKIPKFGTKDSSSPRFEGDFELVFVPGYNPG